MEEPDFQIIRERFQQISERVNNALLRAGRKENDAKIIAVSKTHPFELVLEAYNAGIRVFGENYVQEIKDKHQDFESASLEQPEWHFIGHLQSNKVKYISPFVDLIHSCDSFKLAEEIDKRAAQNNRIQKILLQINTSGEYSKSGCEPDEAVFVANNIIKLKNIELLGLMTIGTFTDDESVQRKEFSMLRNKLEVINKSLGLNLKELSMGMTGDYETAIDEGATMVRIGTALFGPRDYSL